VPIAIRSKHIWRSLPCRIIYRWLARGVVCVMCWRRKV